MADPAGNAPKETCRGSPLGEQPKRAIARTRRETPTGQSSPKGNVSLVSEVFVQNYPYARSAIKFPRATRDVAELTTIRRKARGARVSAFLAVSAPQRQRSRRRATYPFGSGGPFRVMPGPASENTNDAR